MYVSSVYVEENRRAFLYIYNFETFVDELYWIRKTEDKR